MVVDIGASLRKTRRAKGLSQRRLADQTRIANATISQIEAGKANPTIATLERIASGLGVGVTDLLAGRKTEGPDDAPGTLPLIDAIQHLSEGFALFDSGDRLVLCNKRYRDFYGYKKADLKPETTITDLLNLDITSEVVSKETGGVEATRKRIRRFRMAQDTFEVPLADGRWVQVRDRPTSDGGTVSLHADITEHKRAEEIMRIAKVQAEQTAEARSQFVAMVSHEVRTPMNGVLGMARLLQKLDLDDEQRECTDTIVASGVALLTIIDDLLDVSKLDAGKLELERIPFIAADVVAHSIAVMAPRANEKGLAFTSDADPALPPVLVGDPHRLRQVLLNLLSNAIKFTDEGSVSVKVELTMKTGADVILTFAVSDTGQGISAEEQKKLFAEYTQASMAIAREHGGTGLGLAICRRLVGLMDGEVSVESVPGEGSTFSFTAEFAIGDAADADQLRHRPEAPSEAAKAPSRPLRILQVEDNEINRKVAEKILTRAGHQVTSVENGAEALDVIESGGFDIVLMDRDMPVMDGIEATRRIRAMDGPLSSIPIVGITAGAIQKQLDDCLEAGMNVCLTKPVDDIELRDTLEGLAGGSLTVLIIDDTEINRTVAAKQLAKLGIPCDAAESGAQGLKMAEDNEYGAILVDISMPEMDGMEFTERFRQREQEQGRKTPVIAMTGHKTPEDRKRFLAAGMDDVLVKPVVLEELAAALKKHQTGAAPGKADRKNPGGSESGPVQPPIDLGQLSEILGEEDEGELFLMLGLFVESFPELLASLQDAVAAGDARSVHDRAHAAKSAATSAAAVPLSGLLQTLENDADKEDWPDIANQADAIESEYARITAFCRENMKEA